MTENNILLLFLGCIMDMASLILITTLLIGSAISGMRIEDLSRAMTPFFGVMLVVPGIITYVPDAVLFPPNLMMPLNN